MGHEEVVAMARKNQRAQKRPRTAPTTHQPKQVQKSQKRPLKPKYPGTQARPQWLKNAKARLTKRSEFDQQSKAAALQQSKAAALQQSREDNLNKRKQLYSSSSDNVSYTSINKQKLKFSPTVKIMSVESDSPRTPPIEIITSSNPNDFMQDTNEQPQPTTSTTHLQHSPGLPSCSYTPPKGIMKSSPKIDKTVEKTWKSPGHDEVIILGDISTEDFPVQPQIKQIEVVFLGRKHAKHGNTG